MTDDKLLVEYYWYFDWGLFLLNYHWIDLC